jgi:outer membrane protein
MNRLLLSAAAAASLILPQAATAQNVPAAVIAVVDLDKVTTDCNACKTARATLQGQVTALQNREKALAAPLEAEGKAIQTAINALNGKDPDAALQARVKAFQSKREQGAEEIAKQQQQIQRNSAYVSQQIQAKLNPIYQQVMQRRGANILMEVGATLATSRTIDVTNDVLTALNTAMPSVSPPAPAQAQQQQPQGR